MDIDSGFTADKIAFAVLFGGGLPNPGGIYPGGFPSISGDYYFKKIATPARLALPEGEWPSRIPAVGTLEAYAIQRVFLYHHRIIFLAENLSAFVAYEFRNKQVNDVCDLATRRYLQFLRR